MPTVTVKTVTVSGAGFTLNMDTDLTVGGIVVPLLVYIGRDEWTGYKSDNPTATMDDFILMKVQEVYVPLTKVASKAATMVNKILTW
jgi:hypothetical protein